MTHNRDSNSPAGTNFNKVEDNSSLDESSVIIEKLEEENRKLHKELEKRSNELLKKARQVKDINRELDSMVYTISHDLRSPISNIEGLLEALYLEIDNEPDETQFIKNLLKLSIDNLQTILANLSEIAHIQKNDDVNLLDLKEVFEDVKFNMYDEVLKVNAQIEIDFTLVPSIYFSRQNLKNIFFHLLSNALKFSSPERIPLIRVSSTQKDGAIVLSFEDNGLGVREKDAAKIFSLFKRSYTHVSGSGIGLFIVKRILDHNSGKIELESKLNEGATFRVFLPIEKE